jgi:hypothetical protein
MAIQGSTSKGVTLPKKIAAGPLDPGLPPMSYSQAAGGTANPMNVYQMQAAMQNGNITKATTFGTPSPAGPVKPYITSTPTEYNAAKTLASDFQRQLGLKGDMGGPPMSYTGGMYPGNQSTTYYNYNTPPTSGYFSSQAPDTRVYTPKPYDTAETWEYAAAKAMADAAIAAKTAAGGGSYGGGGGYGYGGGGGGGGMSNWSSGLINWRI